MSCYGIKLFPFFYRPYRFNWNLFIERLFFCFLFLNWICLTEVLRKFLWIYFKIFNIRSAMFNCRLKLFIFSQNIVGIYLFHYQLNTGSSFLPSNLKNSDHKNSCFDIQLALALGLDLLEEPRKIWKLTFCIVSYHIDL